MEEQEKNERLAKFCGWEKSTWIEGSSWRNPAIGGRARLVCPDYFNDGNAMLELLERIHLTPEVFVVIRPVDDVRDDDLSPCSRRRYLVEISDHRIRGNSEYVEGHEYEAIDVMPPRAVASAALQFIDKAEL